MAKNISLLGADYPDVPAVELPQTGGGTATFTDVGDTTATANDVLAGKTFYTSSGQKASGAISVPNVVDNLTSTSATDALSANQGRVLNNKLSDTGWMTVNTTYPTHVRAKNGFVTIVMRLTGGSVPPDGQLLYSLPAAYRPPMELAAPTQNLRGNLFIQPSGNVSINQNNGQTLNAYMAATVTYPIET